MVSVGMSVSMSNGKKRQLVLTFFRLDKFVVLVNVALISLFSNKSTFHGIFYGAVRFHRVGATRVLAIMPKLDKVVKVQPKLITRHAVDVAQ